jgi:CrcB protein
MGVLMVLIENVWTGHRLLRPFLGVGVLGGYTTFSAYVLDINQAVAAGRPGIALVYLAATPLTALIAVWATASTTGWALRRRRSTPRRSN